MRSVRSRAGIVALVGLGLGAIFVARSLAAVDWDPSLFAAFGEEATPTREYAEERLGEVYLRTYEGHDGKFFFVQASDPWLLDPEENAFVLDRPAYRSQRMLYPVLAGGGGLFGPETILWAMIAVNVAALGFGTWAVARIAAEIGGSAWWGMSFALNPGMFSEIAIGGAGVLASALAFAAVLKLLRERHREAIAFLALAVLAREAMLLAVAGSGLWLWLRSERRLATVTVGVPALAAGLWAIYVRIRVGDAIDRVQIEEIGLPFRGFIEAFSAWKSDPLSMAAGVAVMAVLLVFALRVIRSRHLVGLAFVGFVVLAMVFTEQVWRSDFDITRAVAPALTAFVLLAFLASRKSTTLLPAQVSSDA